SLKSRRRAGVIGCYQISWSRVIQLCLCTFWGRGYRLIECTVWGGGIYTRTSFSRGSNAYRAGRRPAGSSITLRSPFSTNTRVNREAVAEGIPLVRVNRLFRNTGFVKTKSKALTLHFEARDSLNSCFMVS